MAPGATSTSTVTVTPANGFNSAVALTCAITSTPAATVPPTCNFSSASVAGGSGDLLTLTVTTKAAGTTSSARPEPGEDHTFYAVTVAARRPDAAGSGADAAQKETARLAAGLSHAVGSGLPGGLRRRIVRWWRRRRRGRRRTTPGTTAGTYTVAVTGTAGSTMQSVTPALTVTVQ